MTIPRRPEPLAHTTDPLVGEPAADAGHDVHEPWVAAVSGAAPVDPILLRSDEERSWDRRLAGQIEPLLETCRRLRERNLLE